MNSLSPKQTPKPELKLIFTTLLCLMYKCWRRSEQTWVFLLANPRSLRHILVHSDWIIRHLPHNPNWITFHRTRFHIDNFLMHSLVKFLAQTIDFHGNIVSYFRLCFFFCYEEMGERGISSLNWHGYLLSPGICH